MNSHRAFALKSTAVVAGMAAIAISATPGTVIAQSGATNVFPALQGIKLTTDQQAQVNQVIKDTLFGVKSVLSPEQQEQLKTMLDQGKPLRESVRSLDLSMSQKRQLQSTMKSARSQLSQVLTLEQQQQWQQNVSQQR